MSQRDEVYGFDFALPESYSGIVLHNPTGRHGRWNPRDMGYHLQNGELRLTTSSKTPYEYIGTWAHDQNHCDTCWQCKQICKICTPKEENVIINEADLQLRVQMEKRKLEEEVERKRQIVERQKRMAQATELWRAESPAERALVQPDLGDLLAWLMERGGTTGE